MKADDAPSQGDDELSVLKSRNEQLEASLRQVRDETQRRLIQAELKAEATKSGIIDIDGLRLVEHHELTIDDQGQVKGAAEAVARLRRNKPWLFGAANSSSAAGAPPSTASRPKLATEMTLSEWREARAELLRRR